MKNYKGIFVEVVAWIIVVALLVFLTYILN